MALVAVSLTACGGSNESSDEPSSTPSDESSSAPSDPASSASPPGDTATPTPTPTVQPPSDPGSTSPTVVDTLAPSRTLSGVPTEGVESGCVVMESGGQTYLLLNLHPSLVGSKITVRGSLAPDQLGTCQQGIAFQVEKVMKSTAPDDPQ